MPDATNIGTTPVKTEGALPNALIRTMRQDTERLHAVKQTPTPVLTTTAAQKIETRGPHHERRARKNFYIISAAAFLVFFIVAAALFLQPKSPQEPPVVTPPPPPPSLTPPSPFFAVESARTVNVTALDRKSFFDALRDTLKETEREGTIKRLILKVQEGGLERFLTPNDFFQFALLTPPPNFLPNLDSPFMLFLTYDAGGGKLGFATKTKSPDRSFRALLSWEPTLFPNLQPLLLPTATTTPATSVFEDRTYRNIDWRYLKLSGTEDTGIGYAVFPGRDLLIITSSKTMMETVLNRLLLE